MAEYKRTTKTVNNKENNQLFLATQTYVDAYKPQKVQTRTVLFVGKTRSGKTTALKMLKDPTIAAENPTMFSQTKEASVSEYYFNVSGEHFNLKIMDTPGLKEVNSLENIEIGRSDDVIENVIIDCANYNITHVNLIFITVNLTVGLPKEDFEVMSRLSRLFKEAKSRLYLLVSGFEAESYEQKIIFQQELLSHPDFLPFKEIFENKIYFTGAFTESMLVSTPQSQFNIYYDNIQEMRYLLYKLILDSAETVSVFEFDSFKERKAAISTSLDLLTTYQAQFISGTDGGAFEKAYTIIKPMFKFLGAAQKSLFLRYEHIYKNKSKYKLVSLITTNNN